MFTHAAVGYAVARLALRGPRPPFGFFLTAAVLPVIPDLDVFLRPWVPYGHPLAHRGFTHSLAFALLLGMLAAVAWRSQWGAVPGRAGGLGLLLTAVVASHGLLDALTDGGSGIAFFLPFDAGRYAFPVRPIPVSPIGVSALLTDWGVDVLLWEVLLVWSFAGTAVAWAHGPRRLRLLCVLLAASGVGAWVWRLGGLEVLAVQAGVLR